MNYEIDFLKALLLTITIETTVLFLLFKFAYRHLDIRNWLLLLTGILATFATLPYLWFILPMFLKTNILYVVVSEAFALVVESFIILGLLKISYKNAFIVSAICNAISFLTGLLIKWV